MNLRQVRQKIKSISNVKKITRAMQMVAAVKMRKAQSRAKEGEEYRQNLRRVIGKLSQVIDKSSSPLFKEQQGKELILLVSANKGLCGAFNSNLFRYLYHNFEIKNYDFVCIGKKGVLAVHSLGGNIVADFSARNPITVVSAVFNFVLERFLSGENGKIHLVYNKFISTFKYEPVSEIILPVSEVLKEEEIEKISFPREYIIEPSPKLFLENLLRAYVEDRIRAAILSSEAGEYSARMLAMKNATENAGELIYHLTLVRNKLRQEKITYELLDMVTAKESVEGN